MPRYITNTNVLIKDPEKKIDDQWYPAGAVIEISLKIALPYIEGGWIRPEEPGTGEGGETPTEPGAPVTPPEGGAPVPPPPAPLIPPVPPAPGTPEPTPPEAGTPEPGAPTEPTPTPHRSSPYRSR